MDRYLPLNMTCLAIFAIQIICVLLAMDWYPDLVSRLIELRGAQLEAGSPGLKWNALMTLVIVSPMLLFFAPYQIAFEFWKEVRSRMELRSAGLAQA